MAKSFSLIFTSLVVLHIATCYLDTGSYKTLYEPEEEGTDYFETRYRIKFIHFSSNNFLVHI